MLIEQPPAPARPATRRWILISAVAVVLVLAVAGILVAAHWPFTQAEIIKAIEESSAQSVQIRAFHQSYFPPGCTAEGVTLLHGAHRLAVIERLEIRGSYAGMISSPKRVPEIRIMGMRLTVPRQGADGGGRVVIPLTAGKDSIAISRIVADGTLLEFESRVSGGKPYRLKIERLALTGVGSGKPMSYRTTLVNSEPPGVIRSEGKFGPWDPHNPLRTPVEGSFTYEEADLGIFRGISGRLRAKGEFKGPLGRMETSGETAVPDFHVDGSSHRVRLTTHFHAFVNGGNGDTLLDPVNARFLNTAIRVDGPASHNGANFILAIQNGRIEDVLRVFVSDARPPMSGALNLQAKFHWPPGPQKFLRKIRMEIDFGIARSRFASPNTQGSLDRLSESVTEDPSTALSDLRGHASVRHGVATFSNVSFSIPGASATLHGTYGLIDHRVDLHGALHTRGKLSATTDSGFKSLLLKAITPFFKRKKGVKIVPFKITGPAETASVSLELGSKNR